MLHEKPNKLIKVRLDSSFDFAPPSLAVDSKFDCTTASSNSDSCCSLSRKVSYPVFSVGIGRRVAKKVY